jgi:maltose phosphorylase
MAKSATRYLEVSPWVIEEKGFHRKRALVSESIFSVGNEFMGVRGYFEEGYSGTSLQGSYFNGVFERFPVEKQFFRGITVDDHTMVNAVDWLYTRIWLDGEQLDLAKVKYSSFSRRLDMRTGVLTREFVWTTKKGKKICIAFRRFTNMRHARLACQNISFRPLNFSGTIRVETGCDFSTVYRGESRWECAKKNARGPIAAILGTLPRSGHMVFSSFRIDCDRLAGAPQPVMRDKYVGKLLTVRLTEKQPASVQKIVVNITDRRGKPAVGPFWKKCMGEARRSLGIRYGEALQQHVSYWADTWRDCDIVIDGDKLNQQGIRFCIFQLHQTYHGVDATLNVSAKGLTGEVYDGKTWWDTETYCLPFFLFNNPKAARNLLEYRYNTLKPAVEYAAYVDGCEGARYPMCTIDGAETCNVWQHGALEIHVTTAIAYGIWHYTKITGDTGFLYSKGIEILLQVCRYNASRGEWSQKTGEFGYWNVMGPDEFHMQVHNNAYTNVMAKKMFEYTLSVINKMRKKAPRLLSAVRKKVRLRPSEPKQWKLMAKKMRTNFDKETELYEQHDGFFDLPHIDCDSIPASQFPLYRHWPYLKIFRYDMLKQPDALLLLFFFSRDYSLRAKKVNLDYYEPRCIHESSLSPAIHSIMAAELGRHDAAYRYFGHATRLDLDDYNRNTFEGLHTTSSAGAWMNIVQGFGGMRTDGDVLDFYPSIPKRWRSFSFRIVYRGSILEVRVDKRSAAFCIKSGKPISIRVFSRKYRVGARPAIIALPRNRIG